VQGALQKSILQRWKTSTTNLTNPNFIKLNKEKTELTDVSSTRIDGSFFSVAITTPFEATQTNTIRFSNSHKGRDRKHPGLEQER